VVIVGAGPVGLALALALKNVRVTVLDAQTTLPATPQTGFDPRVYAVSDANWGWVQTLVGGAPALCARTAALATMRVFSGGRELTLNPPPGAQRLATIVENAVLAETLTSGLEARPYVSLRLGEHLESLERDDKVWRVRLVSGDTISADLLVGADGAHSQVRGLLGWVPAGRSYDEMAIVAHVVASEPHHGAAYQWFGAPGTLAWLPMPDLDGRPQISIVWSTKTAAAEGLMDGTIDTFVAAVEAAGASALGKLSPAGARLAFPLRLSFVEQPWMAALVLIGDAAHTLHPLAGQGVNLGLSDARCLADLLNQRGPAPVGDAALLARYSRSRSVDVALMQGVTDGLDRFVAHGAPPLQRLAGWGFASLNRLPAVKSWVSRAMR
jgi:ubiquinone biosynthesis UbiH/UbiF/VisC/COQ6 family hydroxylase